MSITSISVWQGLLKNQDSLLKKFTNSKAVTAAIAQVEKDAPKIKTVDDLMKNRKVLTTILSAYGMDGEINNLGRLKKILSEDPADPQALANKLLDQKFKKLAADLNFANGTPSKLTDADYLATLKKTFGLNEYEKSLATTDPALRQAAYFARKIGDVTSVYQIIADPVLMSVVKQALQLPDQIGLLDVEKQASIIEKRIKISDLQGLLGRNKDKYDAAAKDQVSVTNVTKLTDAATGAVKGVMDQIAALQASYKDLPARTDPSGINAATIALQQNSVPKLIDAIGLIGSAQTRLDGVGTTLTQLGALTTLASTATAGELLTYQQQFSSLIDNALTGLSNATYTDTNGVTSSMLLPVGSPSFSVEVAPGQFENFSGTDVSQLQTYLNNAKAQFAALNAGDNTSGVTAELANATDSTATANSFIAQQKQSYNRSLEKSGPFLAGLNTADLNLAVESAADALTRAQTIDTKLTAIKALVQTATDPALSPTDRADVQTQFTALQTDIDTLINTPGTGLQNFLQAGAPGSTPLLGAGFGSAQLTLHTADYTSLVSNQLAGIDLSTWSGADAGLGTLSTITSTTVDARRTLQADGTAVDTTLSTFDPRGALDQQLRDLVSQLPKIVASAEVLRPFAGISVQSISPDTATKLKLASTNGVLVTSVDKDSAAGKAGLKVGDVITQTNAVDITNASTLRTRLSGTGVGTAVTLTVIRDGKKITFDVKAEKLEAKPGNNLLAGGSADESLFITNGGLRNNYQITSHSEFAANVSSALTQARDSLRTSNAPPTSLLQLAYNAAQDIYSDLTGDARRVTNGAADITATLAEKAKAEADSAAHPYQPSKLPKSLALRFLAYDQGTTQGGMGNILSGGSTLGYLNLLT